MLTVAQLPAGQLAARLAGAGLYLQTGAFVTRLQSTIPGVVHGVGLMYADYPLGPDDGYADFHLSRPVRVQSGRQQPARQGVGVGRSGQQRQQQLQRVGAEQVGVAREVVVQHAFPVPLPPPQLLARRQAPGNGRAHVMVLAR